VRLPVGNAGPLGKRLIQLITCIQCQPHSQQTEVGSVTSLSSMVSLCNCAVLAFL
jgi:hypothetical protein